MRTGRIRGDLALVREGVEVAIGFGIRSVEGLADVAELLERSVYEPNSLRRTPDGVGFTLLNPPLRMGAFSAMRLILDGAPVDPTRASLEVPPDPPRAIGSVTARTPLTIPVGRRTLLRISTEAAPRGRIRVRLELQSVAVPPLVWFEFSDDVREPEEGPR